VSGLVFTTPATTASNVGCYAFTPGGATAANYDLRYVPGTLTINPAALTIVANDATRAFGDPNPPFNASFSGFVNGDGASIVSGLGFTTPANSTSLLGDYAITPRGAVAPNYVVTFRDGTLHVSAPTVPIDSVPTPVVTIDHQPVTTDDLAVVTIGDRPTLVNISNDEAGTAATSPSATVDGQMTVELGKITNPPDATGLTGPRAPGEISTATSTPNFGRFELVAALGSDRGAGAMGSAGGLSPAQLADPGLYREATVNHGGYRIIYHEPLGESQQAAASNAAQGSSYREFPPTEVPRVDVVRGGADQSSEPSDSGTHGSGRGGAQ
jgi:hypothetical protein